MLSWATLGISVLSKFTTLNIYWNLRFLVSRKINNFENQFYTWIYIVGLLWASSVTSFGGAKSCVICFCEVFIFCGEFIWAISYVTHGFLKEKSQRINDKDSALTSRALSTEVLLFWKTLTIRKQSILLDVPGRVSSFYACSHVKYGMAFGLECVPISREEITSGGQGSNALT